MWGKYAKGTCELSILRNVESESGFEAPTLPETNMAPENTPLEKEIPIGNHHFWVLC